MIYVSICFDYTHAIAARHAATRRWLPGRHIITRRHYYALLPLAAISPLATATVYRLRHIYYHDIFTPLRHVIAAATALSRLRCHWRLLLLIR